MVMFLGPSSPDQTSHFQGTLGPSFVLRSYPSRLPSFFFRTHNLEQGVFFLFQLDDVCGFQVFLVTPYVFSPTG